MKKVAIIGAGISGLTAAYLLRNHYHVSLYEKNCYFGGHARTFMVNENLPIDTGFIVFNQKTYPTLIQLFNELEVPIAKSNMSFGVSLNQGEFEYGTQKLTNLFAQPSNMVNPVFFRMLMDIIKFCKTSIQHLKQNSLPETLSLKQYLKSLGLSPVFETKYLIPMSACIWSTAPYKVYEFPALFFLKFFQNHGLLNVHKPLQWNTVQGGSHIYVKRIIEVLKSSNVKHLPEATHIDRQGKISITDCHDKKNKFDFVVLATHPNQALELLNKPSQLEKNALADIPYSSNLVTLHQDSTFMPKRKKAWSSWVYLSDTKKQQNKVSMTYWMNNLQPLNTHENFFVTINPEHPMDKSKVINEHCFSHPQFSEHSLQAQRTIKSIQGQNNTFYCGAYLKYGFHEDGARSAANVAKSLGAT